MVGRIIIALLVICSAGFVAWQKQRSEVVDLGAAVADTKAADFETRAANAEKRAQEAEERLAEVNAKLALCDAALKSPEPDPGVHIEKFAWRNIGAPNAKGKRDVHFLLTLEGPTSEITRIELHNDVGHAWDTTGGTLAVSRAGKRLEGGHLTLGDAVLDLSCSDSGFFVPGVSFTVKVTRGDGVVVTSTTTL